jgi:hypothetical protein
MSANTYDELDPNVPCAWCGELVHCHKHDEHWCDKKAFQLGHKSASESGLTGPNGGELVYDAASGAIVELLTSGGSFPTHPATDPTVWVPAEVEIAALTARVKSLEAALAETQEALVRAARLEWSYPPLCEECSMNISDGVGSRHEDDCTIGAVLAKHAALATPEEADHAD